uniref:Uncharacterized protein n=1 Tax=Rhizophora mucronata TaxID=61149 RepID=A0A2P2M2S1_RHIMU
MKKLQLSLKMSRQSFHSCCMNQSYTGSYREELGFQM